MSHPDKIEIRITASPFIDLKGGEKEMVSEWEELEKLTKDELIIELVKSRWQFRNLQRVLSDLASNGGSYCQYEPGQRPSDAWARKIADYVFRSGPADLEDWGVDESTANFLFDERFDFDDAFKED